ncbi:RNA-binding protein 7 [Zerene cesonia]|uniref:RNA-binding protein 7 n=1 Tax=Zerene cesonia TaxID=33412 RepID=UPI0018E56BEE|nr:RNA-binding protein 7 [Zerene cesonia]
MSEEDNKTLWCGNLSEQVNEEILYELFLQAGPLEKVRIARDRDGRQKNFAFITFNHEVSVPYAINLFRGTALFNRTLLLQTRGRMVQLPPPIRCYGIEMPMELQGPDVQQFSEMTEKLMDDSQKPIRQPLQRHDSNDKLVMASLQGNWLNRHHPYRPKEKHARDDYRHRDNRNKHQSSWRDRRNHRNYRRD